MSNKTSNANTPIAIIDLHAVLHIVKYGGTKKISSKELDTFVVYNFLYKLRHICAKIQRSHVVFACDSVESKRKKIFRDYKGKRRIKTPEQKKLDAHVYPQFEQIRDYVLPEIGYENIFEDKGYEADDVIAQLCNTYTSNPKIIITEDKDLYQCLSSTACVFSPKNCTVYTKEDFIDEYRLRPSKWVHVKTIGGCVSDCIPGLEIINPDGKIAKRGIGEKTAIQYLRGELNRNGNAYLSVKHKHNEYRTRLNKRLVTLPYPGIKEFKIKPNNLKIQGLLNVAEHYGFDYIADDIENFSRILMLR